LGAPDSSALILIFAGNGDRDELMSALSIDGHSFAGALSGECIRVDVDTLGDTPVRLNSLLHCLRSLKKRRSEAAGSNAAGSRASCISLSALRRGWASVSARGVGTMPSSARTNSCSVSM
jgi:hypothetical protein